MFKPLTEKNVNCVIKWSINHKVTLEKKNLFHKGLKPHEVDLSPFLEVIWM